MAEGSGAASAAPSRLLPGNSREGAVLCAGRGMRVFPVFGVSRPGPTELEAECACGNPECESPGKHPVSKGWQEMATSSHVAIKEWFSSPRPRNFGIALDGEDWTVVEVDPYQGGRLRDLRQLVGELGPISMSGRGFHVTYRRSNVPNGTRLGAGITVRSAGYFVVGPGSTHYTGRRYGRRMYGFDSMHHRPDLVVLLGASTHTPNGNGSGGGLVPRDLPAVIHDGEQRWRHLLSLAGTLRRRGLGATVIVEQLDVFNRNHCRPPKPDADVERIARWVVEHNSTEGLREPPPVSAGVGGSLEDVHSAFSAHLFLPDLLVVDVGLATYVAHRLPGDPLWVQLVGASGSGKTEVVQSLTDLPEVHPLSKLTPQTFVSGFVGKTARPASLLLRMQEQGRSFLTLKDFTTVLQMPRDARQEIVAQLRELYDGSYQADYGNATSITWTGRLGFLAGVTPVVDSYRAVTSLLGERFVYYRLPPAPRAELSRSALKDRDRRRDMREELRAHVRGFLESLDYSPPGLSPAAEERLVALADFTTLARSGVERDSGPSRDILALPEPEAPTRYVQQLAALTEALIVMGYAEDQALTVAVRVARDSVQSTRRHVLRALRENDQPNTSEVARLTGLPTSTARLTLGDLTALGLAERLGNEDSKVIPWRLSDQAAKTWGLADPEAWEP